MHERLPQFVELERLLQQAGIIDECSRRLVEELQDHYKDSFDEALLNGSSIRQASESALDSIGSPADIVAAAREYRDLLSVSQRYPIIAGVAHGVVSAVQAPALSFYYCARRADSIARWSASVGLAGMFTAALLLSLHSLLGAI